MNASNTGPETPRLNEFDERLLQRCLDDELTPTETRQLMKRLESIPGGWKALACGFLEERLFARAIRGSGRLPKHPATSGQHSRDAQPLNTTKAAGQSFAQSGTVPSGKAGNAGNVEVADNARNAGNAGNGATSDEKTRRPAAPWWSHPLTSLSLCAAIAFVSGLLVPDFTGQRPTRLVSGNRFASGDPGPRFSETVESSRRPVEFGSRSGVPVSNYSLQILPGSGSAQNSVSIPVVSDPIEWSRGLPLDFDRASQSQAVKNGMQKPEARDSFQLIRIPMDDQKDILMFVRDRAFVPATQ